MREAEQACGHLEAALDRLEARLARLVVAFVEPEPRRRVVDSADLSSPVVLWP